MRQFFIGEVPEYLIIDGVVHVRYDAETEHCMPLRTFRMAVARAQRALVEHDGRGAKVISIEGRSGGHAASS